MLCLLFDRNGLWTWLGLAFTGKGAPGEGGRGGSVYCILSKHASQLQGQNLSQNTAIDLLQLSIAHIFDVTARLSTGCNACGRHRTQQVFLQLQLVS